MIGMDRWTDDERLGALTAARRRRGSVRPVSMGDTTIGGDAPVSIQSMTNTPTEDWKATLDQIYQLAEAGCQIVRVAVPTLQAARVLHRMTDLSPIPVVADIHFNHRLALESIDGGVAGIRLNPGNIGSEKKVAEVTRAASAAAIPIRIGVNGGSLEKDIEEAHGGVTAAALVDSALRHVTMLEKLSFHDIIISLKSSSVPMTIEANRLMAERRSYPLHIGITEAGSGDEGRVKSLLGVGLLLLEGIGETIRISLTGPPVHEIVAARNLVRAIGRFGW